MQSAPAVASNTQPANPNKALWEKGDFTRIAATMRESGDALVSAMDDIDPAGLTPTVPAMLGGKSALPSRTLSRNLKNGSVCCSPLKRSSAASSSPDRRESANRS